jgi:hypothetical protein
VMQFDSLRRNAAQLSTYTAVQNNLSRHSGAQ